MEANLNLFEGLIYSISAASKNSRSLSEKFISDKIITDLKKNSDHYLTMVQNLLGFFNNAIVTQTYEQFRQHGRTSTVDTAENLFDTIVSDAAMKFSPLETHVLQSLLNNSFFSQVFAICWGFYHEFHNPSSNDTFHIQTNLAFSDLIGANDDVDPDSIDDQFIRYMMQINRLILACYKYFNLTHTNKNGEIDDERLTEHFRCIRQSIPADMQKTILDSLFAHWQNMETIFKPVAEKIEFETQLIKRICGSLHQSIDTLYPKLTLTSLLNDRDEIFSKTLKWLQSKPEFQDINDTIILGHAINAFIDKLIDTKTTAILSLTELAAEFITEQLSGIELIETKDTISKLELLFAEFLKRQNKKPCDASKDALYYSVLQVNRAKQLAQKHICDHYTTTALAKLVASSDKITEQLLCNEKLPKHFLSAGVKRALDTVKFNTPEKNSSGNAGLYWLLAGLVVFIATGLFIAATVLTHGAAATTAKPFFTGLASAVTIISKGGLFTKILTSGLPVIGFITAAICTSRLSRFLTKRQIKKTNQCLSSPLKKLCLPNKDVSASSPPPLAIADDASRHINDSEAATGDHQPHPAIPKLHRRNHSPSAYKIAANQAEFHISNAMTPDAQLEPALTQ